MVVSEKRSAFEDWLLRRDDDTYDRHCAQGAVVKHMVKVAEKNCGLAIVRLIGK